MQYNVQIEKHISLMNSSDLGNLREHRLSGEREAECQRKTKAVVTNFDVITWSGFLVCEKNQRGRQLNRCQRLTLSRTSTLSSPRTCARREENRRSGDRQR
jgi:hypothetical protein